jgi:exopolysaccharide biosynthesis polyprenyl glycosylphosphotransferase
MLIESPALFAKAAASQLVLSALASSIRDTDIRGWYEHGSAVGLIFTEIGSVDSRSVGDMLLDKVRGVLSGTLTVSQVSQVNISVFVFPDDWDKQNGDRSQTSTLYPDLPHGKTASIVKRSMDIAGALAAVVVGAPVLLAIAAAVRLTSKGPILFRQERIGQYGRKFTFLKFRSMHVNNDPSIHEEYIKQLISGSVSTPQNGTVYKLTNDPRITPVGQFLRKTSLDELPQFFNVLLGEMSLVGPRPPIAYEVKRYDIWHRRRLLAVKPGITGLWQVKGRSSTTFDEMVRLDLQYARSHSVWLDVKILWSTPRAVVMGDGAY